MAKRRRRGITLIELLIVVSLIGMLSAILLVALGQAREAVRRTECASHLRQLGIALANYHATLQSFPPAAIWSPPGEPLGAGLVPIGVIDRVARFGGTKGDTIFANWVILLLPYLEQLPLYQTFDPRLPISHPRNAVGRARELPVLGCASDPNNNPDNHFLRGAAAGLTTNAYARGNFAINVGPDNDCVAGTPLGDGPCVAGFQTAGGDLKTKNREVWGSGIAGVNHCFGFRDLRDGASHTVALDELRAGLDPLDPRGVWALGQIGSSAIARHGKHDDAGAPNHNFPSGEAIIGCLALTDKLGMVALIREQMACYAVGLTEERNAQVGARSLHPGGVQVLLCDGASRFIADSIDAECWHAIHTRDRGEPLNDWD